MTVEGTFELDSDEVEDIISDYVSGKFGFDVTVKVESSTIEGSFSGDV